MKGYRISGTASTTALPPGDSSDSAATPPLPPDSKALRSESEMLATKARGSCGVDPGPV
jgi:hypothetical protein